MSFPRSMTSSGLYRASCEMITIRQALNITPYSSTVQALSQKWPEGTHICLWRVTDGHTFSSMIRMLRRGSRSSGHGDARLLVDGSTLLCTPYLIPLQSTPHGHGLLFGCCVLWHTTGRKVKVWAGNMRSTPYTTYTRSFEIHAAAAGI